LQAEHLDPTASDFPERVRAFDVAFVNVHGPYGEDGRLQGLLDYLHVPYTSSGVLAGSVGMDKLASKAVFRHLGMVTPCSSGRLADVPNADFPLPAMLKAVDGGSSVGLCLVETQEQLAETGVLFAQRGFHRCFLEEFVDGRAMTVSVLGTAAGPMALPPLEFITEAAYYDEATKLGGDQAPSVEYRVPDDLEPSTLKTMTSGAEAVYEFLDCRGAIRLDYIIDAAGSAFALEVNTVPGLQRHSNLPAACERVGISYETLIVTLLVDALANRASAPWRRA
jgi:D-alanine-D-alanine ligase